MNDIRPRNIGANGMIFDPALDPIVRGLYWATTIAIPTAAYFSYGMIFN